jgi:hypothetical protein
MLKGERSKRYVTRGLNSLKYSFWIIILASLLSACTTFPKEDIEVTAEADPKVNFSGYKTYTWLGSAGILNDPLGTWEPPEFDIDQEVRDLIERELIKRGMVKTMQDPDMLVLYALGVDMAALELKENPEAQMKMLENVPRGAMLILMIDPDTDFVIWVGAATAEVQQNPETEVVKSRLDYAVTQMIKKLPK